MKLLITGATGNVGLQLIKALTVNKTDNFEIFAGVRDIDTAKKNIFQPEVYFRVFDFYKSNTYIDALSNIDILFLLRPPQITNIKNIFKPLIKIASSSKIKKIVFLSVQGADKISFIPHNKIEKLIINSGINYVFVRPSYFMQNLSTILNEDLKNNLIFLPAKNALFNFIDVLDIADFCKEVIVNNEKYNNKAYTLTGDKNYSFYDVKNLFNELVSKNVIYKSPNPLFFILRQLIKGKSFNQSFVILILHFIQRFQSEPDLINDFEKIMKRSTRNLEDFIKNNYSK